MDIGNWTDRPVWYVSVRDAGRTALVLGPFRSETICREWAYRNLEDGGSCNHNHLLTLAEQRDPKSWFYSWGMVKMQNGHRDGALNQLVSNDLRINGGIDFESILSRIPAIPA